jgi:GNAT superfamily N-acetyltransferase
MPPARIEPTLFPFLKALRDAHVPRHQPHHPNQPLRLGPTLTAPSLPLQPILREAGPEDIPELVRVTNLAYAVESFCLRGERTDEADVRARMAEGQFLVCVDPATPDRLLGSVFVSMAEGRGYLGTLSVDPACQGRGLARALVEATEALCRRAGCSHLDLNVVNLRRELFPYYAKLGFVPTAILPFPKAEKVITPLHLVQMTKVLLPPEEA